MANANTPFGLKPIGGNATVENGLLEHMYMPADYATDAYVGDPVIKVAAGANDVPVTVIGGGTFEVGTLREVNVATVGDTNEITGVIVGFLPTTRDSKTYGEASTVRVAIVNTDPYQDYLVQAAGAIAPADIGLNGVLINVGGGSTTTGLSGMELNTTTDAPAADASNQLIIRKAYNAPDNETNAAYNKVIVRINLSTEAATRSGNLGI